MRKVTTQRGYEPHPQHPNPGADTVQILIGSPTLGIIRMEWHNAMTGMVSPPNWSVVRSTPTGYTVADAQNLLVDAVLRGKFRALLLIEDDTCPPPETLIVFDRWLWKMERRKAPPVISGLYHIKGSAEVAPKGSNRKKFGLLGPEPLIYRGSGTRAYRDWTPGDVVACSGVPTGALLIHRDILEAWAREPDVEAVTLPGYPTPVKRIFQSPSYVWTDPATGASHISAGTSDLWWSAQTIARGIFAKAGWPTHGKREYPFLVDTSLRFGHVDRATGRIY